MSILCSIYTSPAQPAMALFVKVGPKSVPEWLCAWTWLLHTDCDIDTG